MLISPAFAQAAGGSPESSLMSFIPLILMFVVLYFLMIRPQMKRAKEHKSMLAALSKGDEVVTAGGVVGKITEIDEASSISVILPTTPPAVTTSSPLLKAASMDLCSLARFICGRIIKKYSTTNIRMSGIKLISEDSGEPPAACAKAGEISTEMLLWKRPQVYRRCLR